MNYYIEQSQLLITEEERPSLRRLTELEATQYKGRIMCLNRNLDYSNRVAFRVNHLSQLCISKEDEKLLCQGDTHSAVPSWLQKAVKDQRVISVNSSHIDWRSWTSRSTAKPWRIHVVGLGDVGGILLTGLRLLGYSDISVLGLYDPDPDKCARWQREIGQICIPFQDEAMDVTVLREEELFDCDMLVFCASRSVPPLDNRVADVRMVQFAGNSEIIRPYAERAVREGFSGIFAVVSDPVDHLCKFVYETMNETAASEGLPYLKADQIRGYGLGVMNGRAAWYARQDLRFASYLTEGRAYGPHGKGLIIANSISSYDHALSEELTKLTMNANFEVRSAGFKPYVAPALSSGAISLLCTLRGQWHYSAVCLGGVFMGCKNRMLEGVQETECVVMPEMLMSRIVETAEQLRRGQ